MSKTLLEAKDISYSFGQNHLVLDNVNFILHEGESLGILGPNGGGKSTLLKIIVGLLPIQKGKILTEKNLIANGKLGYVPQQESLNDVFPLKVSEYLEYCQNNPQEIDHFLGLTGMLSKKDSLMRDLSGGQRQRVLLTRALLGHPKILVLDEPSKGLDSTGQDQLLNLLKEIKEKYQTGIIIVDHNINQIVKFCDRLLCLNRNFHWHNKTELLTKNILEHTYHCEFEHLMIHDVHHSEASELPGHEFCQHEEHLHGKHPHMIIRGKK